MIKKIQNIFLLNLIVFTLMSCREETVDFIESTATAKEVTIPDSAQINEQVLIDMIIYGSSGCSVFSKFKTVTNADTTSVKLYQRRDKNVMCTTEIIEITESIELTFEERGTKYLVFNKGTEFEILDSIGIQ